MMTEKEIQSLDSTESTETSSLTEADLDASSSSSLEDEKDPTTEAQGLGGSALLVDDSERLCASDFMMEDSERPSMAFNLDDSERPACAFLMEESDRPNKLFGRFFVPAEEVKKRGSVQVIEHESQNLTLSANTTANKMQTLRKAHPAMRSSIRSVGSRMKAFFDSFRNDDVEEIVF